MMTGQTTRPVTFAAAGADKVVRDIRTFPAGTTVYVSERRNGNFKVRIPGTLLEQEVYPSSVEPV